MGSNAEIDVETIEYDENKIHDPEKVVYVWNVLYNGIVPAGRVPTPRLVEKELIDHASEKNLSLLAYHPATRLYMEDIDLAAINGMPVLIDHEPGAGIVGVHGGAYVTDNDKQLRQHFTEDNMPADIQVPGGGAGYKLVTRMMLFADDIPRILKEIRAARIEDAATSIAYVLILANPGPDSKFYAVKRIKFLEGSLCREGRNAGSGVIMTFSGTPAGRSARDMPCVQVQIEAEEGASGDCEPCSSGQNKPAHEHTEQTTARQHELRHSMSQATDAADGKKTNHSSAAQETAGDAKPQETPQAKTQETPQAKPQETPQADASKTILNSALSKLLTADVVRLYGGDPAAYDPVEIVNKMSQASAALAAQKQREQQEQREKAEREERERQQTAEREARELLSLSQQGSTRTAEEQEKMVEQLKSNRSLLEAVKEIRNHTAKEVNNTNKREMDERERQLNEMRAMLERQEKEMARMREMFETHTSRQVTNSMHAEPKKRKIERVDRPATQDSRSKQSKGIAEQGINENVKSFTAKYCMREQSELKQYLRHAVAEIRRKHKIQIRDDDLASIALFSGRMNKTAYAGLKPHHNNLSQRECIIETMRNSRSGLTPEANRYLRQRREEVLATENGAMQLDQE
jgi:hypothetical protein